MPKKKLGKIQFYSVVPFDGYGKNTDESFSSTALVFLHLHQGFEKGKSRTIITGETFIPHEDREILEKYLGSLIQKFFDKKPPSLEDIWKDINHINAGAFAFHHKKQIERQSKGFGINCSFRCKKC
ncbi:MAG: hypothetical protein F6K22_27525 [Okeania sp. SIO2F4]|uniref:hypothetical protein n=1 Tax=Okeania sp. SIO2F4 TaxID=2607790 RepID=UPI00142B78CA|nr:hypothetical protein [Okeania sp. SIO2F4]NES06232.1 hypothetical protein [Okeania sp. SIO2F4]